ncbi:HigA family addiction module antidote protein [Pusillimonas sp. MFBS29]|nr:HigA family addiction module antidote protein [Pusillimonas sp. MFBS29]
MTQYSLAKEIGVSVRRINEIVKGLRAFTADTNLRLARFFDFSDDYWLRAQVVHDTEVVREKMQDVLAKIQSLEHA